MQAGVMFFGHFICSAVCNMRGIKSNGTISI